MTVRSRGVWGSWNRLPLLLVSLWLPAAAQAPVASFERAVRAWESQGEALQRFHAGRGHGPAWCLEGLPRPRASE